MDSSPQESLHPHRDVLLMALSTSLSDDDEYEYDTTACLTNLPDDIRCHLASFLLVKDVLSLLTVNRDFHCSLGGSSCLWRILYSRDGGGKLNENALNENASSITAAELKHSCLKHAYLTNLPMVQWCELKRSTALRNPSPREGHSACVLGPPSNRMMVLTGGFTGDRAIHMLAMHGDEQKWSHIRPSNRIASFVYGASLTAIDDRRAVRYGGFRGGGYSGETDEVWLLTLNNSEEEGMKACWDPISVHGRPAMSRAYHSATLVNDRYLVIIGGMKTSGCVLEEAVLDVESWTWLPTRVTLPQAALKPSGRHGHSVVLDEHRNRLVLFGGGSGSDLLRSGRDNSEVWELKMSQDWKTNVESSFPWEWSKIHGDALETENDYGEQAVLSPTEQLCLGRCHIGGKVSANTVLLAFGSGRPSTNGLVAYDLRRDCFHRPQVSGSLPRPRFTAAGAIVDGWLVVHGGYSVTNYYGTLGDIAVLDLAPGLKRTFEALPTATPWLQQAITVLKSVDESINATTERESMSLMTKCLHSLLLVWIRLTRKALKMARRARQKLQMDNPSST